jgi:hypothetical protein
VGSQGAYVAPVDGKVGTWRDELHHDGDEDRFVGGTVLGEGHVKIRVAGDRVGVRLVVIVDHDVLVGRVGRGAGRDPFDLVLEGSSLFLPITAFPS